MEFVRSLRADNSPMTPSLMAYSRRLGRVSVMGVSAMMDVSHAAAERIDGHVERYCDADGCAVRYGFSRRHWFRLVDSGRAPQPTRFGRLVRWSLSTLAEWERDGCRPIRVVVKAVRA